MGWGKEKLLLSLLSLTYVIKDLAVTRENTEFCLSLYDRSSFISSLGGAVASTPLDVVRTRVMNQRKLKSSAAQVNGAAVCTSRVYASALDCMVQTVKLEGPLALYKGFIPTWLRLGPWNIIFFVTFEQLKKLY